MSLCRLVAFLAESSVCYIVYLLILFKLTCDPFETPETHELRRIAGNVGRPGLTLLIPPDQPMISTPPEENSWRVVSTTPFNGLPENHFSKTSMHLSFTDYYVPLVQSYDRQGQDSEIHLLESVVSVHHEGIWIGDVDVLGCLLSSFVVRPIYTGSSRCSCDSSPVQMDHLLSVETWNDILEPPLRESVIRAHGSWVGRLATALIYIQARSTAGTHHAMLDRGLTIYPNSTCWKCMRGLINHEARGAGLSTARLSGTIASMSLW